MFILVLDISALCILIADYSITIKVHRQMRCCAVCRESHKISTRLILSVLFYLFCCGYLSGLLWLYTVVIYLFCCGYLSKPGSSTWSNSLIIGNYLDAIAREHVLMLPPYKNNICFAVVIYLCCYVYLSIFMAIYLFCYDYLTVLLWLSICLVMIIYLFCCGYVSVLLWLSICFVIW